MASKQDVAKIVMVIGAAYPNWKPSEYTVEVYFQTLSDLPADLLHAAALKAVAEPGRAFAPSVGEIRGCAGELKRQAAGVLDSYQAWEEVCRQLIENGGEFGTPIWSSPLVERAMKSIGWRNLRMSENQVADRARFIEAYNQVANRAERDEMDLPQVREYLEEQRVLALETGERKEVMLQLADRMSK